MSVVCVVQARMGSSRLPGKVLMDLGGQPLLALMLQRLRPVPDATLVVATSAKAIDDPIAECAEGLGVDVVRGDELDVLARYRDALERFPADHVVRLTADCPLADPTVVSEAIDRHIATGADYTSNTLIRTYPDGLDVEVISSEALRHAITHAEDPAEREHVTPYLYRRNSQFRLAAFRSALRLGHLRWTVDTAEDLDDLRSIVEVCNSGDRHDPSWLEVLDALPPSRISALTTGLEPAVVGEVPEDIARFDDPSHPVLVYRCEGTVRGWLRVEITDARAAITGSIRPEDRGIVENLLADYVRSTPQILEYRFTPTDNASLGATR